MKRERVGEKKEKLKKQKVKNIKFYKTLKIKRCTYKLIYILLMLIFIYNIIFLINSVILKNEYFKFSKINMLSMNTDLMENDISKNSLVIVKKTKKSELKNNDIIAYEVNGKIRINRLINKYNDENSGQEVYSTKSNLNYYPDIENISYEQIIGKKIINIPFLGVFIKIFQSKIISFVCTFILILMFIINDSKIKREKRNRRKKM